MFAARYRTVAIRVLIAAALASLTAVLFFLANGAFATAAVAITPWALWLVVRYGGSMAAAVLAICLPTAALLLGVVASTTALDFTVFSGVAFACSAAVGGFIAVPRVLVGAGVAALRDLLKTWWVGLGGALWVAAAVFHSLGFISLADGSLRNDSGNNIVFAMDIVHAGGVEVVEPDNPVPLPHALLAFLFAAHPRDIAGNMDVYTLTWTASIAGTCLLTGALALMVARRLGAPDALAVTAGAVASLMPHAWVVTGFALQFGFFNATLTLMLILASAIVALEASARPTLAAVLLCASGTAIAATWTPLTIVPIALFAIAAFRNWRRLLTRRSLAALTPMVLVAISFALGVAVPSYLSLHAVLAGGGGILILPRITGVAALGVSLAVGALMLRRAPRAAAVVVAVPLSAIVALGLLLASAANDGSAWAYYTYKLNWLSGCLGLLIAGAAAVALIMRIRRRRVANIVVFVGVAAFVTLGLVPQASAHRYVRYLTPAVTDPAVVASSSPVAEEVRRRVSEPGVQVAIGTGSMDEAANFLTLLFAASDPHLDITDAQKERVRSAAYASADVSDEGWCNINAILEGQLMVRTSSAERASSLGDTCPNLAVTYVGGTSPTA